MKLVGMRQEGEEEGEGDKSLLKKQQKKKRLQRDFLSLKQMQSTKKSL